MKVVKSIRNKLLGLIQAVNRYPLTMLFLLAAATVNVNMINNETEGDLKYLFTFIIGALLSVVAQQIFERFFMKTSERILLMGGAVLLSAGYFFAIRSASTFNMEIGTKTAVAVFALVMAFIWVPSIRSKVTFNQSFLSVFKSFFMTVLFAAVISLGLNAIILAIDELLFSLDFKANAHVFNIVYTLFAPIFFLSFTPPYPGKKDAGKGHEELALQKEKVAKAVDCPKMLEVLISYIIIPLTAVYTVILLAYVLLNIRGEFWTNNLLEPMLVSYAIIVILVYILASNLENKFASLFRRIFPKVLIPIVLFQTIASVLKIGEMGVTHGRYYAIMFGVFAVIAGIIFSFFPIRKNGWIAGVLIIFSAVSIIPPVDAFTVSRENQINLLENILTENGMLENGEVIPNADISAEDKKRITRTVSYINSMDYNKKIDWLPDNIFYNDQFKKTFGFNEVYDETDGDTGQYAHLDWEQSPVVNIENYDRMIHLNLYNEERDSMSDITFEINGVEYILTKQLEDNVFTILLVDEDEKELIKVNSNEVFDEILEYSETDGGRSKTLSVERATVTRENDEARMQFLINSVDRYKDQTFADMYVFLKVK